MPVKLLGGLQVSLYNDDIVEQKKAPCADTGLLLFGGV